MRLSHTRRDRQDTERQPYEREPEPLGVPALLVLLPLFTELPGREILRTTWRSLKNVLLQKDWEVSESYEVRGTPSAVLISADGKVASPVAGGAEGIRGLLSYAVGEGAQLPMQPHHPKLKGSLAPTAARSTPLPRP